MPVSVSIAGRSPKVVIQVVELEESHYSDSGASLTTILETFWLFSLCSSLNILVIGTLWADWSWAAGAAPNAIEFTSMVFLFKQNAEIYGFHTVRYGNGDDDTLGSITRGYRYVGSTTNPKLHLTYDVGKIQCFCGTLSFYSLFISYLYLHFYY
jgi:hypothetical protein